MTQGERNVGELEALTGIRQPTLSHHFRVLRDAGLVQTRNVGTTHMNALRAEELNERFPGLLTSILAQA